jgi:putative PIN family toxin of toxin-antitoxin system
MRVVLDTNVLVSALLSPGGTCDQVVRLAVTGALPTYVDSRVRSEYVEVLHESGIPFPREDADELLDLLRRTAHQVQATPLSARLPHEDDRPFLEVAAAAQATLVTGNTRHFPKGQRAGVAVLTPRELIELLRQPGETRGRREPLLPHK